MNVNAEIWLPVVGFEGLYEVSNKGRVRSLFKGKNRILSMFAGTYYNVNLNKRGVHSRSDVHRLVAKAFIPNPDNLPEVNHKNEDKLDNRVENLEWVTHKYNIAYSHNIEKSHDKQKKRTEVFDLQGNSFGVYESAREVCRQFGLPQGNVADILRGRGKSIKGYTFKYV